MNTTLQIDYVADAEVDASLDLGLRGLLSSCFTKPQDHVFKTRRYFHESPAHRWLIRDEAGAPVAHVAAHDKRMFTTDGRALRFGGIAEVCVRKDHQGRGYVKPMIAAAHRRLREAGVEFSVLSGNERYYASSGYRPVDNVLRDDVGPGGKPVRVRAQGLLVAALTDKPWPTGDIYVPGPPF